MKPWQTVGAATVGVAGLLLGALARPAVPAGELAWVGDYEAARTAALQNGKPLFVLFR